MNLDPEKLMVLFVIGLLVLGPNRLPQAARSLGKGLAEVRKYTNAFRAEVNDVLAEPKAMVRSTMQEVERHVDMASGGLSGLSGPYSTLPPGPGSGTGPDDGPATAYGSAVDTNGHDGPQAGLEAARPTSPALDVLPAAMPDEPGLN